MKKILYSFMWASFILLSSCTINDNGEFELTWLFWVLLIGFVIVVISAGITGNKEKQQTDKLLKQKGLSDADFTPTGSYVGGHPDCDNTVLHTCTYVKNGEMIFCDRPTAIQFPVKKFTIRIEKIKNISVEDSTSIDKKITLGRVLLVGVFALAWRKKKKNELAFVTIDWNDGKFDHSTIFSFEGKDAMQNANTARNKLIKIAR